MKMKIVLILVPLAIILTVIGVYVKFERDMNDFFTYDAVLVISLNVSSMMTKNPNITDIEIDELIKHLHHGSVINIAIDANGNPTDVFGNRFYVQREIVNKKVMVKCTSPGRDRKLNTSDDIVYDCSKNLGAQ